MESVGGKSRPRRSFTPEFKAEIVELRQCEDRSAGQVANDFDRDCGAGVGQAGRADAGTRAAGA